jgi:molybdopterin synthase catalytic subunit
LKSVSITRAPIDLSKVLARVKDPSAGGTVLFIGTVRNVDAGKRVYGLEYEVYLKMAENRMLEIEQEVRKKWRIKKVWIVHRRGRLKVGDVSVAVAVSAEHRAEAFEASRYAIDRLKRTVPIWKKETGPGGLADWIEGERIERR